MVSSAARLKDLVEQFDARPVEIKALFSNTLVATGAAELRDKMLCGPIADMKAVICN